MPGLETDKDKFKTSKIFLQKMLQKKKNSGGKISSEFQNFFNFTIS